MSSNYLNKYKNTFNAKRLANSAHLNDLSVSIESEAASILDDSSLIEDQYALSFESIDASLERLSINTKAVFERIKELFKRLMQWFKENFERLKQSTTHLKRRLEVAAKNLKGNLIQGKVPHIPEALLNRLYVLDNKGNVLPITASNVEKALLDMIQYAAEFIGYSKESIYVIKSRIASDKPMVLGKYIPEDGSHIKSITEKFNSKFSSKLVIEKNSSSNTRYRVQGLLGGASAVITLDTFGWVTQAGISAPVPPKDLGIVKHDFTTRNAESLLKTTQNALNKWERSAIEVQGTIQDIYNTQSSLDRTSGIINKGGHYLSDRWIMHAMNNLVHLSVQLKDIASRITLGGSAIVELIELASKRTEESNT